MTLRVVFTILIFTFSILLNCYIVKEYSFLVYRTHRIVYNNNKNSLCRLCVSAIGCCCRLIFWPCTRRSASRGGGTGGNGRGKRGERREKVSDQDWSEMMSSGHDLELT
mmetsp:Transcript_7982/g.10000  ORF Transcript_7982/g.10000 Transcript_7982/m.10000 type:complete len:109 (-) Transcript_7982:25-351(-)